MLSLLVPSYGQNGVKVSVNAALDYDKLVSEDTQYTPSVGDNGMIDHEEHNDSSGTSGTSGDIVGVEPNADGTYPTADGTQTDGAWSDTSSSTSYLVNTLKKQSEKQGYYVNKVSVSVVIYKDILGSQEKQSIINTTTNAAGTQPEYVSVENLPLFEERVEETPGETVSTSSNMLFGLELNNIVYAAAGLVLLLIIILIISGVIRKKRKKKMKRLEAQLLIEKRKQEQANEIHKLSEAKAETKEEAIRREIGEFAENSPEVAAQLLKSILREDGDK